MKIRCKNCYRILNPQEEYCTNCGEHSQEIQEAMRTGNYEGTVTSKWKLALSLFIGIGFFGNGISMVLFAVIQNNFKGKFTELFCRSNAFLVSSIILLIICLALFYKELKAMFFNGTAKQHAGAGLICLVFVILTVALSQLSTITKVIPQYMTDYLTSDGVLFEGSGDTSILRLLIALIASIFVEEFIFRKRLLDVLDDATMLGDGMIIFLGALLATALEFLLFMSAEMLIVSFIIHAVMCGVYLYTNRSIGINIITRILIVGSVFAICIIK